MSHSGVEAWLVIVGETRAVHPHFLPVKGLLLLYGVYGVHIASCLIYGLHQMLQTLLEVISCSVRSKVDVF